MGTPSGLPSCVIALHNHDRLRRTSCFAGDTSPGRLDRGPRQRCLSWGRKHPHPAHPSNPGAAGARRIGAHGEGIIRIDRVAAPLGVGEIRGQEQGRQGDGAAAEDGDGDEFHGVWFFRGWRLDLSFRSFRSGSAACAVVVQYCGDRGASYATEDFSFAALHSRCAGVMKWNRTRP